MNLCLDEQIAQVELEIDGRILDLWEKLLTLGLDERTLRDFAPYLRAAFAQGYYQAHTDPVPGYMYRTHGFATPQRQRS